MTVGEVRRETAGFRAGYRNGHLDAVLGLDPCQVASTAERVPGYGAGYRQGYADVCLDVYRKTLAAYRQARRESEVV